MDAIILAGGLGTRLRSVVKEVPKCMAPVAGKPFLWYLLSYLNRNSQIDRVVLSVGYLRDVIFDWVKEHEKEFQFPIVYAVEETPLGTGGGIRLALSQCVSNDVLVLNGDTMFEVDLTSFIATHQAHPKSAISLALKPMCDFDRYGTVETDAAGQIVAFGEKQPCKKGNINGGVYIVRRSNLDMSGLPQKFSFEKEIFEPHVAMCDLLGVVSEGYFIDIGIPEDYRQAQFDFLVKYHQHRTLLLDRDGTINVLRPNDYVKCWDEFEFLPWFLKVAPELGLHFRRIFVVTNQRGIGKGLMTEQNLADIHEKMCAVLDSLGCHIENIYHCTALNNDHPDRKPQTGMWQQICEKYPDVSASETVMVGDGDCDEEFARNCKIDFVRV